MLALAVTAGEAVAVGGREAGQGAVEGGALEEQVAAAFPGADHAAAQLRRIRPARRDPADDGAAPARRPDPGCAPAPAPILVPVSDCVPLTQVLDSGFLP